MVRENAGSFKNNGRKSGSPAQKTKVSTLLNNRLPFNLVLLSLFMRTSSLLSAEKFLFLIRIFIFVFQRTAFLKKSLAITLLLIHLVCIGGYRFFFDYLENEASSQIVERLDGGGFSENELIEIKIPYPLPYAANHNEYERFDGEVDLNGAHYNYVKRKMVNDTLYLLCIPNSVKNELAAAKSELIAGLSDIKKENPAGQKAPFNSIVKPFTTEFSHTIEPVSFTSSSSAISNSYLSFESLLLNTPGSTPFQPPKA